MLYRSFQIIEFTLKVWNSISELIHTYTSRLCSTPSSTSLAGSGSINILWHSVVRITSKRYRGPNNVQSTVSSIQNSSGMFYLSNLWAVNALCEIEKKGKQSNLPVMLNASHTCPSSHKFQEEFSCGHSFK